LFPAAPPRIWRAGFAGKLIQLREGSQVRLLHGIFGGIIIAENRSGNPKQPLIVPADDQLEQSSLAIEDAPDDLLVGKR
jgi:hypothetical protein